MRGHYFSSYSKLVDRIKFFSGVLVSGLSFIILATDTVAGQVKVGPDASINPSVATLATGQQQKFKVILLPEFLKPAKLADQVAWSVNGVVGGTEEYGRITTEGVYTAPASIPVPQEIHITGEIPGKPGRKLFASVIMAPDKPFYKSIFKYSEKHSETKHFGNPHGVALDKDGNIVIVDADSHFVMRFSQDGKFLGYIGSTGQKDGQFYSPRVVLLDKDGDLYISDQKEFGNRIQIFSHDGKLKKSFAPKGNSTGQLLRAHGMDFDSEGNLYVVDVDNSNVTKFSHEGEFIASWGRDGHRTEDFNAPHALVVDPNNDVFVSGYYSTIQKFDANGKFLFSFAEAEPPGGAVYIHAISDDKWGNVYSMVRGMRGYGGQFEVSKERIYSIEKHNNNGDFICGVNLSIGEHSENWVFVDEKGYLFAIYRSKETAGFEIFAPQ